MKREVIWIRSKSDKVREEEMKTAWSRREEVTQEASQTPTRTKWIDHDGRHFARFRLASRDRKPRDEGRRDDLFVAMPPLEPKQASLAFLAGMREKR